MSNVLLINPWITDFAAYDLWAKPLGLLYLAAILEECKLAVSYIDCLDRYDPALLAWQKRSEPKKNNAYFCGKYYKKEIIKPEPIKDIKRSYYLYGIPEELFIKKLKKVPRPKAILLTSVMTYWYPGTFKTIELLKKNFPDVPVILGGIYPSLCYEHCQKYSQADFVFKGADLNQLLVLLKNIVKDIKISKNYSFLNWPYPAFKFVFNKQALPVLTSLGCPFHCTYCAKDSLQEQFRQRNPDSVAREIIHYQKIFQTKHIAFYDNALLLNAPSHFLPLLNFLIAEGVDCNFHTPNGLHASFIEDEVAAKMYQAGFKTVRLSLETSSPKLQKATGGKVDNENLKRALKTLQKKGFTASQIDVYTIIGLKGQTIEDVFKDILFVNSLGAKSVLAAYSPIPHTTDWKALVTLRKINEDIDPLWHNNTIYNLKEKTYTVKTIRAIRGFASTCNKLVLENRYDLKKVIELKEKILKEIINHD